MSASRGPAGRRKKPRDDKKTKDATRQRAQALVERGMPFQMAMAVANGRLTLNDALQRMATQDKVGALMEKHELSRALATQIAIGHAKLEEVLRRRRLQAHREQNATRSCLDERLEPGLPLILECHGKTKKKGVVIENEAYNVTVQEADKEAEVVHKLQIKFAYAPEDWKLVRKALRTEKTRARAPKDPVPRPQDRYSCSDRRLFRYMDEEKEVALTTLEGEVLRGRIQWFSRFEVALKVKGDVIVWVFRHAVDDVSS